MTAIIEWLKHIDPAALLEEDEEQEYLRAQQRDILILNQRMDEIERRHRSKLEANRDA